MSKLVFTRKARFKHLSDLAARLERQGKYNDAYEAWNKAAKDASADLNKQWCTNRSNFCQRMAIRPFSKE
ncbi:TPA: ANR family transcriptional regulator [Pasteurella multocida]|uniref:ANR family transcriptional regulator n=1 Tax=Pasteurella multocida TaxID=747 RepID=UPI0029A37B3F|nr:ANR family transcriptional regulator [Pasteurella multocida]HEH9668991.1 ANR family transcriptional regulator [Pasteurella multocida]HEH9696345.1 ANR family transcriptional regulator [Pasteurella multocida]HEH9727294.1 ANR family transcriptional regulator [Pasteurella multocida]HEH9752583.1 ANR family transcriptional regulator [Pasteurella multocida]